MATLIGLKAGTTNITVSYTEGGVTKTGTKSNFVVEGLTGSVGEPTGQIMKTFSTSAQTVDLSTYLTGNTGTITWPSSATLPSGWSWTQNTSTVTIPASTGVGNYTVSASLSAAVSSDGRYASATGTVYWAIKIQKAAGSVGTVSNPAAQTYKPTGTYTFQLAMSGNTGTVTYPTSITVKKGSTTVTGWTCTSAGVVTVPAGTNVYSSGYTVTGNVTCAASDNYTAVTTGQSRTWTITLTKKTPTVTFTATSGTIYYDGTAKKLGTLSYDGDGTLSYATRPSTTAPTADGYVTYNSTDGVLSRQYNTGGLVSDAANYYVYIKSTAGTNYSALSASRKGNKEITKRPVTIKAKDQTKTYDGSVLSADNTYEVSSSLSPAIPTGFTVTVTGCTGEIGPSVSTGTKTLGTVVINNSDNVDKTSNFTVTSQNGTLSITQASGSIGTPVNPAAVTFSNSTRTFTLGVTGNTGTVTYPTSITVTKGGSAITGWTISGNTITTTTGPIGTYSVTGTVSVAASSDGNYAAASGSMTWTITINQSNSTTITLTATNATYPDSAKIQAKGNYAGAAKYGFTADTMTSSKSGNANTNVTLYEGNTIGTTTIYAYWKPNNSGYADSSTKSSSATVSAGTLTVAITPLSGTYTGSPQNTIIAVSVTNQKGDVVSPAMTYCLTSNGTYSSTIPQLTNVTTGTSVYWKAVLSGYNDASNVVTATIAKATPSAPNLTAGYLSTYTGSSVYAKASVSTKCTTPSTLAQPSGVIMYGASGSLTNSVTASTIAVSLTATPRLNVGSRTIYAYFKPNDTTNYNNSSTKSTTASVGNKAANTVTYAVQSSSVWCGTDASARSTTDAAKTVTIATNGASSTAGDITYAITVKNTAGTTVSGWSIANTGKTVTTSATTPAGVYTVTATATAASTSNYLSGTKSVSASVTVSAVTLDSVILSINPTSIAYNTSTSDTSVTASYTNGSSTVVTTNVTFSTNPSDIVTIS